MIDHNYKIVTHKALHGACYVAKLSDVYIILDDEFVDPQYPKTEFFGSTPIEAMTRASDSLRRWLKQEYPAELALDKIS